MKQQMGKIVQIGFNKCATRSLYQFFKSNGLRAFHWDGGKFADDLEENVSEGRPAFHGWEDYDFYSDMNSGKVGRLVEGHFYYAYIAECYPDSRFILNIRNVDKWIKSRFKHNKGYFAKQSKKRYGAKNLTELEQIWRDQWDEHLSGVKEYFKDQPERLLIFDIEKDSGKELVEFFSDLDLDASHYGYFGKTGAEVKKPLRERLHWPPRRSFMYRLKQSLGKRFPR